MQEKSDKKLYLRIERLKAARQWTWEQVSGALDLSVGMLMMVKSGKRGLSTNALYRLEQLEREAGVLHALEEVGQSEVPPEHQHLVLEEKLAAGGLYVGLPQAKLNAVIDELAGEVGEFKEATLAKLQILESKVRALKDLGLNKPGSKSAGKPKRSSSGPGVAFAEAAGRDALERTRREGAGPAQVSTAETPLSRTGRGTGR